MLRNVHVPPIRPAKRSGRLVERLLPPRLAVVLVVVVATLNGCSSGPRRVIPPEPPSAVVGEAIEHAPSPAPTAAAYYAILEEAENESPPPRPELEGDEVEAPDAPLRSEGVGSELPPLPEHSREQELQELAEAHSEASRELAGSHRPVYVLDDLLFAPGSARLTDSVRAALDRLVERLQLGDLDYVLEIRGHTDATGADAENLQLGDRRAEAVRDYLQRAREIPEDRLVTLTFGELLPIAADDHPNPFSRNRRVTVRVLDKLSQSVSEQ